ncbi:MAG: phospholipase D family protein [Gammaproteobacteria bacterium]|nr:phospholipase D family protein [Gammaproteobacteria bacterium]
MPLLLIRMVLAWLLLLTTAVAVAAPRDMEQVYQEIARHPDQSGVYVLDRGEQALLARAWLADHARQSIEVQYFIWSTDNIGVLASEALLRAAGRGVKVRVIVDDLMIDAPDKSLLALALHPNIDIHIYNPRHSVGTPWYKRLINVTTDFRGVNQRMHDKTFIVDGRIAIVGGRNMADEYYDYDQEYNFRDRDALVLGKVVQDIVASFERFWSHPLSVPVQQRFNGLGLFKKHVSVNDDEVKTIYRELHDYAHAPDNFKPEVRDAISSIPEAFDRLAREIVWTDVYFICDLPGKNSKRIALSGGGAATTALVSMFAEARKRITIQSPYLVLSDEAFALFRQARKRGVQIRISTNSLASTDNMMAFSGYRNQRRKLIKLGVEVFEYRPDPEIRQQLLERYPVYARKPPVFAIHAKTMVVDGDTVFIGTYNLDPRSENLNTEVGLVVSHAPLAAAVEKLIEVDMLPENSWPARDRPDSEAGLAKRMKVKLLQLMPIKPLL